MKKVLAVILTAVMVLSLAACGALDINKIKGEWTTSTINGKDVAAYAQELGVDLALAANNVTIKEDGTAVFTTAAATATYKYEKKSNGIEILDDAGAVYMSMAYDAAADTLTYKLSDGTNEMEVVLKKGTTDLTVTAAPEEETPAEDTDADEAAPEEDEAAEDEAADDTAEDEAADDTEDDEAADDAADDEAADDTADDEAIDDTADEEVIDDEAAAE